MIQSTDIEYIKYGLYLLRSYTASNDKKDLKKLLNHGVLETFLILLNHTDDITIVVIMSLI
jgi:hypothetical protein